MPPLGKQWIAGETEVGKAGRFHAANPLTREPIDSETSEADGSQVARAASAAANAFEGYRKVAPKQRAVFLRTIAANIEALGETLIERADLETALGVDRLRGERARTTGQLKLFADLIEEGSWVDARIDHADPNRKPMPKPDVRRMLIPIGPVAVFAASNFPLAFSVPGGDTASALAAGCPVVVKAHPAHPGTSELVAGAITQSVRQFDLPAGVFSLVHGTNNATSISLVQDEHIAAVAFTGSLRGGRALFDAAAARPKPIPVFAEMGSVNPVFILPGALAERKESLAQGLKQSITAGVGQFCTKPGVVVGLAGDPFTKLSESLSQLLQTVPAGALLHGSILEAYARGSDQLGAIKGVGVHRAAGQPNRATPTLFTTDGAKFLNHAALREELFGPSSVLVEASDVQQMLKIARAMDGHLTATVHGTEADIAANAELIDILQQRVGRVIINGYPTGVEVCSAMNHGGPYPATTDARSTSVGTAAIERFVRPICLQGFPTTALPPELQDANPRNIWRLVDNRRTKDSI